MANSEFSVTITGVKEVIERLERALKTVSNPQRLFAGVEDRIVEDIQDNINRGYDYYGGRIAPLTKNYERAKRRKGYLGPILVRTGNLSKSIDARIIGDRCVIFCNVSYASYLQEGTRKMRKREFLPNSSKGLTPYHAQKVRDTFAKAIAESMRGGRYNAR